MILLDLVWAGVEDTVCFDTVAHSSSFGVLARGVDGVDDCVSELWVADDSLVVHQPHVDDASVGVYGVVWVLCVVLN